ncbi:uncharacterized protein IL334_006816 [Kwoniella shivajii]|uniref:Something about silencing protein 4 domain-containing protein n=1 Tax=Kwoniella shivajii TaxID=564305 RepID=A0ABZ1D7C8_9TREE|nr:hypothetical protein IL334_006816 [Kwoniella shivajii]
MSPIKSRSQPRRSSNSMSMLNITQSTLTFSKTRTRNVVQQIQIPTYDTETDTDTESESIHAESSSSVFALSRSMGNVQGAGDIKGKHKEKELTTGVSISTEKQPERRVLPARIRRSAGGGEGIREVEEMIVDWLERFGEPSSTPPETVQIHLTSLPLDHVNPPITQTTKVAPEIPTVTLTPNSKTNRKDDSENKLPKEDKIEVPEWIMVKPGEDDQEEAREELVFGGVGLGKGKPILSPVKRLRRGGIGFGEELEEDTSDSYYIHLHRKYETFERRQRIREKEKLQHERYKMKSKIDLLKNMPKLTWSTIISTILNRGSSEEWLKGKEKIKEKGDEWLKRKLVKEGEEVLKRFEELLPPEQKKHKSSSSRNQPIDSKLSTSSRASQSPSLTPPPIVLPARVAALRDPSSSSAKRKRRSTITSTPSASLEKPVPAISDTPSRTSEERKSTRVIRVYGKQNRNEMTIEGQSPDTPIDVDDSEKEDEEEDSTFEIVRPTISKRRRPSGEKPKNVESPSTRLRSTSKSSVSPITTTKPLPIVRQSTTRQPQPISTMITSEPFYPPVTMSGLPCLIEAASKRESFRARDENGFGKDQRDIPRGRSLHKENHKVNMSSMMGNGNGNPDGNVIEHGNITPFGVALPGRVEWQSEFTISDEEDFWPIIAHRGGSTIRPRNNTALIAPPIIGIGNGLVEGNILTPEEVEELEGVEAAVVL